MKKSLFLFLLICFFGVNRMPELYARTVTMTEVAADPSSTALQEGDTVTISTKEELLTFASFANLRNRTTVSDVYGELKGITYLLMADIELAGSKDWSVVCPNNDTPFNGTFDGQGYSISHLTISKSNSSVSMFGYVGSSNTKGCVKNLCLKDVKIATTSVGISSQSCALVGFLENSSVSNCCVSGIISAKMNASGLIGQSIGSRIENCYNLASATIPVSGRCVGGIVGETSRTRISFCYNAGNVSCGTDYITGMKIGALCGVIPTYLDTLSNCFYLNTTTDNAYPGISATQNAQYSRTADQFASGQVACELASENPEVWGQWIASEAYQDSFPVFYNAEKHPGVVADPDNLGSFINDGFPVVYYSAALPAGDNIFYPRQKWHEAVAARLSIHPNELAFTDASWEELVKGLESEFETAEVMNLVSRTADGLGWETSCLAITDRKPFYSPFAFDVKKATYHRRLYKDGGYESWYFPLDLPVSQLPEGYNFELYGGWDLASGDVSFLPLASDITVLSGDTPYLFRYAGEDRWTAPSDVEIQWENVSWPASDELQKADVTSETGFYGSLIGQTAAEGNTHLYTIAVDGRTFSTLAAGKTLNPFRCYFYHTGAGAARISVVHRDINSIDAVASDPRIHSSSPVYDLQGRPVSEKSSAGIIIHDGTAIIKQ